MIIKIFKLGFKSKLHCIPAIVMWAHKFPSHSLVLPTNVITLGPLR